MGTGPFMTVVEGKFKRKQGPATDPTARADASGERPASLLEKSEGAIKAPAGELKKLERFVGTWKLAGTVIPAPGVPPMKITATETFRFTHDGQILSVHIKGDPGPDGFTYEGYGYMAWNKHLKRFDMFHINNMGEAGAMEAHFIGADEFVAISSGLHMGQPSANRMHFKFNKDGTMSGVSDQLIGTEKAKRNFEGTYTRVK